MPQPDQITLHLRFGVDTPFGVYQDTLVFTEDDWTRRTDRAVSDAKQALVDTWVAFRSAQIAEEKALATQAGKDAKVAEYEARIDDIQAAIDALRAS